MKKIYSLLAVAALLSVSCAKEELKPAELKQGSYLSLEGTFAPSTRISVGEVSNNVYPVSWTEGDAVGLYTTTEGADIMNIMARLDASTSGQNSGKFVTADPVTFPEGKGAELVIYYPYSDFAFLEGTSLSTVIPTEQIHGEVNTSTHLGKYTLAYSTVQAENEADLVKFSMKHAVAYARVVISTSEFAGYKLKSVVLRDLNNETALSDSVKVDVKTGALTLGSTPKPYVRTALATPHTLTSQPVEVWISAIPADFTSKPLYVAVEMEAADGSKTVTIPVKCNGNLKANAVNTLEISNLSTSSNVLKWYEPVETRLLAGGWAYSDANCYTNIGVNEQIQEQEISVKARGNFAFVNEPKFVTILQGEHNNGKLTTYVNGNNKVGTTTAVSADYTVRVGSRAPLNSEGVPDYNQLGMGEIAVLAADEMTVLWSISVWALYNELQTIDYKCGEKVVDRNLGTVVSPTFTPAFLTDAMFKNWKNIGAYYQWGRPVPFSWSPKIKENNVHAQGMRPTEKDIYTLEYVISHPNRKFAPNQGFDDAQQDWHINGRHQGLWGNPDPTSADGGHKSIYDPCPKGYRIISPAVVNELETAKLELLEHTGQKDVDYYVYSISDELKDYIPTGGGFTLYDWRGGIAGFARTAHPDINVNGYSEKTIACLWGNAPETADSPKAAIFGKLHPSFNHAGAEKVRASADVFDNRAGRANAWPARCMVDKENR